MYIQKKAVKKLIRSNGKQITKGFIIALDRKVEQWILKSCVNARTYKRLDGSELLI